MARFNINIDIYTDKAFAEGKLQEIADTLRTQLASFDLDAWVEWRIGRDPDEIVLGEDELVCAACQKIHVPFVAPGIGDS